MTEGWAQIVAIVEAAAPVEAPPLPAPRAEKRATKSARRQPRSASPSQSTPAASADPPAPGLSSRDSSPASSAPSSPAAAPAAAVAAHSATSSQKGAWREKIATAGQGGQPGGTSQNPPRAPEEDEEDRNRRLAYYPLTDLGNAERFRERNRGRFLWCPALGWLWWDGKRWSRDGADDRVKEAEHDTVRAIQQEAEALRGCSIAAVLDNPDRRDPRDLLLGSKKVYGVEKMVYMSDAVAAWGRQSEQANKLAPIAKRAAPYLAIRPEQLDADPFKFNVANGTLIFKKSAEAAYITFKPHDPADLITKCSPVEFDQEAQSPVFDAFMATVQPEDGARRFLMQWQGLSLTGDIGEQKLCIFWGKGRNGKSTFIDACAYVAGEYGETVPIETFLNEGRSRNAGQATPDLAMLPGVRYLYTSEPNKGAKLDEALIKLATGGDPILARHLNKDFFRFRPQFKLTISGNYRPQISGTDEGIWRRPQLVPWSVTIPREQIDRHLGEKLRAEASGILNRMLDGLCDWFDHGLVAPESVIEATESYRSDSDPLGRFLADCVAAEAGARVQSSVMYALFKAWAASSGAREWSNKGMTDALKERGFATTKSGVVYWLDVRLTRSESEFVDEHGKPRQSESQESQGNALDEEVVF